MMGAPPLSRSCVGIVGKTGRALPTRHSWLDIYRGIAVAGMFLVNYPGSWSTVYWPLVHAGWHGATPADFVFPAFLFAVGVSVTYSSLSVSGPERTELPLYLKISRRTAIIFVLGLFLSAFPDFDLATLRITGVLQRVAICYFVVAVLFLRTGWRTQAALAVALLVVYFVLMTHVSVPGCGSEVLSKDCNLAGYIDRLVLGGRAGAGSHDPEGLLSTLPAVATSIMGALAGRWLQAERHDRQKIAFLFIAGLCGIVAGLAWHPWFPVNKTLWTSSYVLLTAGVSCLVLALCFGLNRVAWLGMPFQILGVNALAAYVAAELGARIMTADGWWNFALPDGRRGATLQSMLYERLFIPWADPFMGSFLYTLAYSIILVALMFPLFHLKIYIKL